MRFNLLNRKIHYWLTPAIAMPFLVILITGMMLQWKKSLPWVQPPDQRASRDQPALTLPEILKASQTVPEARIETWDDIERVDFRPRKNLIKVSAKNHWEIQMDAATGTILQTACRRSDVIEQLHDGSFFHEYVKLWLFFPVSLGVLVLWLTGLWMFVRPLLRRSRR